MKVLQVITSLRTGGAEKLVSEISPLLCEKGIQVDVCTFDGVETNFKKVLIDSGIKVISFGENCRVYDPVFIVKLWRLMKNYDIVHTHNTAPQLFAAIANIFGKTKLVTTEHNTSNRRRGSKLLSYVDRWMYNRYKHIICISNKTEENLKGFIGCPMAKVSTIHNGINIANFSNAKPLDPSSRFVIAMVAGFRSQKDQDTLVRAMSHLDAKKYELWLVGDGTRRSAVENLVSELKLNEIVRFLGIRGDVPSILKSSDIVVMSSHWEGFGLAAVEGMAAGKPVIASNVDGLSQVVEGAGVLFSVGDDKALANEIQKLADDKKYYEEVALKCSKRAEEFDISKMVLGYMNVYKEVYANK